MDINCDIGESVPGYDIERDFEILSFVSSCNIACGFHAGDPVTIAAIIDFCKDKKIKIGAHPGFPDKENFGRKPMDFPQEELTDLLIYQIAALQGLAKTKDYPLHHVKPHGALYNMACTQEKEAQSIVNAILKTDPNLVLYAPGNSIMAKLAKAEKITVHYEVFADRNYTADLTLVPRSAPNALIQNPKQAFKHVKKMITHERVRCTDGISRRIQAKTCCVHGDHPKAIEILKALQPLVS